MIAFLSLVATTEAQPYEQYGVPQDGVPAPQVGDILPDYDGDAVIVDAGGQESVRPLNSAHVRNSHFHGPPVATFRSGSVPEGTPSPVGPYGRDCVNPCQGWSFRNKCPGIPCTDADRQRWQQHYAYQSPQTQTVQPTPAELKGSAELNQIENELVVGKNFSVDNVETEKKAAIEKIQADAVLNVAKVVKLAKIAEDVVDLTGLNNAQVALDRVIDEEAQREEGEVLAANLPTEPKLFMGQIPTPSNSFVNLPQNLQQSAGYQTETDNNGITRYIPNRERLHNRHKVFLGFNRRILPMRRHR
jgi:hypothetical protein